LVSLTLATLLPVILAAALGALLLAQREQSTFERGARARTLAVSTAVDAELKSSITTLQALATSRALASDDLRAFHAEALRVLPSQPDWSSISVAAPSGEQLINVLGPFGSDLPPIVERQSFERVLQTGEPAVGGLIQSVSPSQLDFPVRVPVKREGVVRYVLSAIVKPESIYELLQAQQLPSDWVGVVVDRNRRFVARTLSNAERLGQPASKDLQLAIANSAQGWLIGYTTEGVRVYTAHETSPLSGWTVAIGIPGGIVESAPRQTMLLIVAGALLAGLLAFVLAQFRSQKIVAPIAALAGAANALARGETSKIPPVTSVREVTELGHAFAEAGSAVQARVQTQRQLAAVTDNATVALFMTDAHQSCTFMNPAAERMTGYSFDEARGRPLHDLVHRTAHGQALHSLAECPLARLFAHDARRQGEDSFVHRDGRAYEVAYASSPLRADSVRIGTIVEVRDITNVKAIEAERRALLERTQRARTEAEASNRAKDEFLAMLGHELRNPLSAISNASHLLDRAGSEHAEMARAVIKRQSVHLARLVDDLLDAGRVATGKIVVAQVPVDFAAVIRRTLATLSAAGRTGQHRITVQLASLWVLGDETRLEQVVTNLLTNALRYTPADGSIAVNLEADDGNAVLKVADDGVGIASEMLPKIFDLFVQGDRSIERAQGGLGIGLTLVKRLVELHGGTTVAVSDGVGRGSTFTIRLPAISPPAARALASTVASGGRSRRVLIVEDNADSRAMLRATLELAGHVVIDRADGVSGLDAALTQTPEVALIDVGLPGLSGYELARRVRSTLPGQPMMLIALTGYGQPEDRARALEAGFDAHVVKPVDADTLLETVEATRPAVRVTGSR
jgi:PAS domain S-box-containing protein